jgi:hypothetical protein
MGTATSDGRLGNGSVDHGHHADLAGGAGARRVQRRLAVTCFMRSGFTLAGLDAPRFLKCLVSF